MEMSGNLRSVKSSKGSTGMPGSQAMVGAPSKTSACTRGWATASLNDIPRWTKLSSTELIAVVIRSAPGEPIASTAPLLPRATLGAIFDSSLVPVGTPWNPLGCNSVSPSELFSQNPVPGVIMPDPYPADTVTAHPVPSLSTAEVCTVEGDDMIPARSPIRANSNSAAAAASRSEGSVSRRLLR